MNSLLVAPMLRDLLKYSPVVALRPTSGHLALRYL
jgi:hypothetical protein